MNQTKHYLKYKKLILKFAWNFSSKTGMDVEEWVSELNFAYCKALTNYDPTSDTRFSTLLVTCMLNHFKYIMNKNHRIRRQRIDVNYDDLTMISHDPEESFLFLDNFVNNQNPVIRAIAEIISIYEFPKTGMKSWLKSKLRDYDFKFKEISQGLTDLNSLLFSVRGDDDC